jgi:hypothetical protein
MRWVQWVLWTFLIAGVALFAGDWLLYNLRGARTSKVTVSRFLSAPLKNNKEELDYLGSEDVLCSESLFPQGGHTPCWYLRRHKNQITTI